MSEAMNVCSKFERFVVNGPFTDPESRGNGVCVVESCTSLYLIFTLPSKVMYSLSSKLCCP